MSRAPYAHTTFFVIPFSLFYFQSWTVWLLPDFNLVALFGIILGCLCGNQMHHQWFKGQYSVAMIFACI